MSWTRKPLHFGASSFTISGMTQPLVLLMYERVLPGSQLVNRLQDLDYRVATVSESDALSQTAERELPLLIIADLMPRIEPVCEAIRSLKQNPATTHVPVIAFLSKADPQAQEKATQAGATLVVTDAAISHHLKPLLDQALTEF
jgi:CheY-like chemotaxis protein